MTAVGIDEIRSRPTKICRRNGNGGNGSRSLDAAQQRTARREGLAGVAEVEGALSDSADMMSVMIMGLVQLVVVALAALARWTSAGWYLLIGTVGSLGLVPLILFGPLVFAGFYAPHTAWPLLTLADLLLLTTALTLADGGDNGMLIPILDEQRANSPAGDRVHRLGTLTGTAYLVALVGLVVWMLAA